jgi:hypothetical protein
MCIWAGSRVGPTETVDCCYERTFHNKICYERSVHNTLGRRERDSPYFADADLTNFARSFDCCTRDSSCTYIMCPAG